MNFHQDVFGAPPRQADFASLDGKVKCYSGNRCSRTQTLQGYGGAQIRQLNLAGRLAQPRIGLFVFSDQGENIFRALVGDDSRVGICEAVVQGTLTLVRLEQKSGGRRVGSWEERKRMQDSPSSERFRGGLYAGETQMMYGEAVAQTWRASWKVRPAHGTAQRAETRVLILFSIPVS